MAEVLKLRLGSDVICQGDHVGALRRIIFVPETYVVTHLDVAPHHPHRGGRLVPIEVVTSADVAIHLLCTLEEFSGFSSDVQETESPVPAATGFDDKALIQTPVFGFGAMGGSFGSFGMGGFGTGDRLIESEALPEGEVDLERGARIYATDGHVGHADGLVIDKGDFHITHLLLGEGHVFGTREVAIPVASVVEGGSDGAELSLSKAEIHSLPAIED